MRELSIFDYKGNQVRTIQKDGETWWVLKDVCAILDIKNSTDVMKRLESDERARFNLGRQGEVNIINESGLYSVILRSDKPEAKPFRKWVTSEVLPSIRRTGNYIGNPDNAVAQLAAQIGKLTEMVMEFCQTREKPKQLMIDYDTEPICSATELLKRNRLGMGVCEFNAIMEDKGYLQEIRLRKIRGRGGETFRTCKVLTEKGLEYGENRENLRCNKVAQPGYYPDSFLVLYRKITEE